MIQQHHVRWQVLILGAQSVGDPRTQARIALPQAAGIHLQQAGAMSKAVGMTGPNDRHVVDALGHFGKETRNLDAGLAVLFEIPQAAQKRFAFGSIGVKTGIVFQVRDRLSVALGQFRLGIEQVDVARSAIHEEKNTAFGFRREMGRLGHEQRNLGRFGGSRAIEKPVLRQQKSQRRADKAAARLPDKFAPRLTTRCQPRQMPTRRSIVVLVFAQVDSLPGLAAPPFSRSACGA